LSFLTISFLFEDLEIWILEENMKKKERNKTTKDRQRQKEMNFLKE